jgi:hypothetical protein
MRIGIMRPRAHLLALVPALVAGCVPGPGVDWLPDSSGFYYTGGKGGEQLRFFDAATMSSCVLIARGVGPAWPAVSPDGKRVALARRYAPDRSVRLRVMICDANGKVLHRSAELEWAHLDTWGGDILAGTAPQVRWSPQQDRLLLSSDGRAGLYDLKSREVTPLLADVVTFGASAVRPDGKGFLGRSKKGYLFFDWQGRPQHIASGFAELFAWPTVKVEDENYLKPQMLAFPWLYASRWDGPVAEVAWSDVQFRVDTDRGTAVLEPRRLMWTADREIIQQTYAFPRGGAVVRVVEVSPRGRLDGKDGLGKYRLEVLRPGAKAPVTLVGGAGALALFPSPDRNRLVVRWGKTVFWSDLAGDRARLLVLDPKGEVLARIEDAS